MGCALRNEASSFLQNGRIDRQAFDLGKLFCFCVKAPKRVASENQRRGNMQNIVSTETFFRRVAVGEILKLPLQQPFADNCLPPARAECKLFEEHCLNG